MDESTRRREALRLIVQAASFTWTKFGWLSAFENLIFTVLSQNTSDVNSLRAYERLKQQVGISPETLAAASLAEIVRAIRGAGLYNRKAPALKKIAQEIRERYPGGLEALLLRSESQVREELMKIDGIGPKTVDILLAFSANRDIVPVDTHVKRIAARLAISRFGAPYDEIRSSLEEAVPRGQRVPTHLALIWHGRNVCKARRPLCGSCAAKSLCPSSEV